MKFTSNCIGNPKLITQKRGTARSPSCSKHSAMLWSDFSCQLLCCWWLTWLTQNDAEKTTEKWLQSWHLGTHHFQWIHTWKGLGGFQKSSHPCAVDKRSHSIGSVNMTYIWTVKTKITTNYPLTSSSCACYLDMIYIIIIWFPHAVHEAYHLMCVFKRIEMTYAAPFLQHNGKAQKKENTIH